MYQNENIEKIMAIHRRCGEVQFRMALQHLFQMGNENFSNENMVAAKEAIRSSTPKNAIMTADYQLQLLDCSFELSRFPIWDVLLYLKLSHKPNPTLFDMTQLTDIIVKGFFPSYLENLKQRAAEFVAQPSTVAGVQ